MSKLALPALDFCGRPWAPLCGPGLGLGLACALGPRRTVAKGSEERKKITIQSLSFMTFIQKFIRLLPFSIFLTCPTSSSSLLFARAGGRAASPTSGFLKGHPCLPPCSPWENAYADYFVCKQGPLPTPRLSFEAVHTLPLFIT